MGNRSENSETQKSPYEGLEPPSRITTEWLATISTAFVGIRHIVYLKTTSDRTAAS
mgnify:FL=1